MVILSRFAVVSVSLILEVSLCRWESTPGTTWGTCSRGFATARWTPSSTWATMPVRTGTGPWMASARLLLPDAPTHWATDNLGEDGGRRGDAYLNAYQPILSEMPWL